MDLVEHHLFDQLYFGTVETVCKTVILRLDQLVVAGEQALVVRNNLTRSQSRRKASYHACEDLVRLSKQRLVGSHWFLFQLVCRSLAAPFQDGIASTSIWPRKAPLRTASTVYDHRHHHKMGLRCEPADLTLDSSVKTED